MEASALFNPLLHEIRGTLETSPYVSSKHLQVEASEGQVCLEGTVGSYFQKQMAQELILRLDGVEQLENKLEVDWTRSTR